MSEIDSFRSIISLWPTHEAMASDIGASLPAVRKWWQRDRIPDDRWQAILATMTAQLAGLTAEKLVALAGRQPAEARA